MKNQLAAAINERDQERTEIAFLRRKRIFLLFCLFYAVNSTDSGFNAGSQSFLRTPSAVPAMYETEDTKPSSALIIKSPSNLRRSSNMPGLNSNPLSPKASLVPPKPGHKPSHSFGGFPSPPRFFSNMPTPQHRTSETISEHGINTESLSLPPPMIEKETDVVQLQPPPNAQTKLAQPERLKPTVTIVVPASQPNGTIVRQTSKSPPSLMSFSTTPSAPIGNVISPIPEET